MVTGPDGTPGARVCGGEVIASADGFQAANVRQAVVSAAPGSSPAQAVGPHAVSGTSAESVIAAASRTSSASVWALKSAIGRPVFRGDHAKPKRPLPAERIAYVCAEM